eukprot:scaffold11024_cov90-Isochrysis_galbana.AAC.3
MRRRDRDRISESRSLSIRALSCGSGCTRPMCTRVSGDDWITTKSSPPAADSPPPTTPLSTAGDGADGRESASAHLKSAQHAWSAAKLLMLPARLPPSEPPSRAGASGPDASPRSARTDRRDARLPARLCGVDTGAGKQAVILPGRHDEHVVRRDLVQRLHLKAVGDKQAARDKRRLAIARQLGRAAAEELVPRIGLQHHFPTRPLAVPPDL